MGFRPVKSGGDDDSRTKSSDGGERSMASED